MRLWRIMDALCRFGGHVQENHRSVPLALSSEPVPPGIRGAVYRRSGRRPRHRGAAGGGMRGEPGCSPRSSRVRSQPPYGARPPAKKADLGGDTRNAGDAARFRGCTIMNVMSSSITEPELPHWAATVRRSRTGGSVRQATLLNRSRRRHTTAREYSLWHARVLWRKSTSSDDAVIFPAIGSSSRPRLHSRGQMHTIVRPAGEPLPGGRRAVYAAA